MTTNEAIKILTNIEAYLIAGNPIWDTDTIREAFDMAIDALENYDGVADALNGYAELYRKLKEKYDNLKKQNQWIPCEDLLPEEGKEVLVTVWDDVKIAHFNIRWADGEQEWCFEEFDLNGEDFDDVKAWCELPKPYEGDTE